VSGTPSQDEDRWIEQLRELLREDAGAIAPAASGEPVLQVESPRARGVLERLRNDPEIALQRLVDLTAIDRSGSGSAGSGRFVVVYALESPTTGRRMRVHALLAGGEGEGAGVEKAPELESVVSLWAAADWLERECFDLFGIYFHGHPDLRRILLEPDFEGAPLRKDHPRQPGLPLPGEAPR